jgi:hypothetical protein
MRQIGGAEMMLYIYWWSVWFGAYDMTRPEGDK